MATRKPRARHHDTAWRPVALRIGHDHWQRQADAAAWSAISGMEPSLYLGGIEPIPVPPELTAQMRAAAAELTAMPSRDRAEVLLRLAHVAAYGPGTQPPVFHGTDRGPPESPRKAIQVDAAGEWWDTPAAPENPPTAILEAFLAYAADAQAALSNLADDPANEGEAPFAPNEPATPTKEWWE
jgi:hypothetical protein